mmetsp:Transcript_16522/g.43242  ORF Transcript_16522/g.43242 Transcript_16522/m.43242 type:complete len:163 (-) Transcript_16522:678-1166(-)
MDRAVREMADERRVTFGFFGFGLICFHITAILFSVLNLKTASAAVVSIILGVFMLAFYTNTKRIYNRMKIDDGDMQTGQVVIGGYAVGEGSNIQSGLSNADSLSKSEETPEDMQKKVAAAYELIQRMQAKQESTLGTDEVAGGTDDGAPAKRKSFGWGRPSN